MSLAVLKRKLDNKERHRRINAASGGYKIAVTNTGSNKSNCNSTSVEKKLIVQQSYRTLYRSRIQKFVEPRTTYKKMPESSSDQYIENKKSHQINDNVSGVTPTDNKMLTAGEQIARVKARRICKNETGSCNNYEMEISGNSASKSVCP
jgi:hypothetical protein